MPDIKQRNNIYNRLEPYSLVDSFLNYPPENFKINNIQLNSNEIYGFLADLDLSLTLDPKVKDIISKLLFAKPLTKIITPNTFFIGTTVSEYSLFPRNIDTSEIIKSLLTNFQETKKQFLIIKDLPYTSPLLSEEENRFGKVLIESLEKSNFTILSGQALAYVPINFNSIEEYLKKFSCKKRYDFKKNKMSHRSQLELSIINTGDPFFQEETVRLLHQLYLNVYENSEVHFDKLTLDFFRNLLQKTKDGKVFLYKVNGETIGFCLNYIIGDYLVDKYRGYKYPISLDYSLFFNQFFDNLDYCIQKRLKMYIMGWTSAKVKSYLGCDFTQTYHAVYIKNPFLRFALKYLKPFFESDEKIIKENRKEH